VSDPSTSSDAGLSPERTRLAWQRSTLTGFAALLVAVRLLIDVNALLAIVVAVTAGLALAVPVWFATQWQLSNRALALPHRRDGRAPLLLAVLVGLGCLSGLAYTLLA
jgi:hypothetical protein